MKHSENSQFDSMMKSIDGIQRVPAPELFYARLRSRMERGVRGDGSPVFWGFSPALLMSALVILLVVNMFFIRMIRSTSNHTMGRQENPAARQLGKEMSSVYYFSYE